MISRSFRATLGPLLLTGILGFLVIIGARTIPLHIEQHFVIRPGASTTTLFLEPGTRLTQEFRSPGGILSGVVVSLPTPLGGRGAVRAVISDAQGNVRARGQRLHLSGRGALTDLSIATSWFHSEPEEPLTVTLERLSGESLPLLVSEEDRSASVQLAFERTGEQPEHLSHDLSLMVRRQTLVSPAAFHGTVAAVVITLLVLLSAGMLSVRRQWFAMAALLFVLIPVAGFGFFQHPQQWGISDWDYYFSLHETYRNTIVEHHVFPLWNPYICGGTAGLGDPEFSAFTPTFLLELVFGVPLGLRLAILLSTFIGSLGMLLLGKRLGLSPPAAFLASLVAFFGSVNLLEIVEGHVNIFAVMWIPWVFWAWIAALRGRRAPLLCGIFLALTFLQGGIYLLFYTGIAFLTLFLVLPNRGRAVRVTGCAILWALGLSAIKLLPTIFWLRAFPDQGYATSTWTLPWIHEIFFGRHLHGAQVLPFQAVGWHEYGAYIGLFAFFLALLLLPRVRSDRCIRILFLGVLCATVLSSAGPLLQPLFDRIPYIPRSNISRVVVFAVIPLALLTGMGVDMLRRRGQRAALVAAALTFSVAVDLLSLFSVLSTQAFVLPPAAIPPPAPLPIAVTPERFPLKYKDEIQTRAYAATLAGYGTLSYCSVLGPRPAVHTIIDERGGQYAVLEGTNGNAAVRSWTPNAVTIATTSVSAGTVTINTNFAPGWKVNGSPAENHEGRVAAHVDAGQQTLTFRYRPSGMMTGLLVTIGTVLFACLFPSLRGGREKSDRRSKFM